MQSSTGLTPPPNTNSASMWQEFVQSLAVVANVFQKHQHRFDQPHHYKLVSSDSLSLDPKVQKTKTAGISTIRVDIPPSLRIMQEMNSPYVVVSSIHLDRI